MESIFSNLLIFLLLINKKVHLILFYNTNSNNSQSILTVLVYLNEIYISD